MLRRQCEVAIQVTPPGCGVCGYPSRRRRGRGESVLGAGRYVGVTVPALPVRFVGGRLPGCGHRPAYRGDCGGWWPRRKPFPASRALWRPVGCRPGFRRAGGAAGARPSRRAAYRRAAGGGGCRGWPAYLGGMSLEVLVRRVRPVGCRAAAPDWRAYPFRAWWRWPIPRRYRPGLTRPLRRGSGGRLRGRVHRPAYRGDCGVRAPDRKPFPASRAWYLPGIEPSGGYCSASCS